MEDNSNKEADILLDSLHKRYDSRQCNVLRRRRSKIAILVMIGLSIVLGVLITISLLMFKSVIYPPTPLDLCKETGYAIIPLGIYGGITEGDLTSFLLTQAGSSYMIALDSGAIFNGLQQFVDKVILENEENHHTYYLFDFPEWAVSPEQQVGWIMKNKIVGYFIGHPHLDHLMGLMSIAPEDYFIGADGNATQPTIPKSIIGLNSTLAAIQRDLFNGVVWADFPSYGRYEYKIVEDGELSNLTTLLGNISQGTELGPTDFPNNTTVATFQTCHDTLNSSAFLFTFPDETQFLFFSDTGVPSSVIGSLCDWTGRLLTVWQAVDLLKIRAIIIEVSFPNSVPDSGMYGHLRPKDLLSQLGTLAKIKGVTSLSSLTVIVEHIKPILGDIGINAFNSDARAIIQSELAEGNTLGVKFIFPEQGQHICI